MDLRCEPRFRADEPVKVTLLGEPETVISGRIVNLSGKGMRLMLESPAPLGAAIRVEIDGTILLGEVCYCYPEGATYAAGLQLEQALTLSEELGRLMLRLLEESSDPNRLDGPLQSSCDRLATRSDS
jgi:hypothetical protein